MSIAGRIMRPRHWSIRQKLTFFAMMTSTVALALAFAGFAVYEYVSQRKHLVVNARTLGQVIAGNSTAAISFNRPDDATATLATLSAHPNVEAACIYTADGTPLASYMAPLSAGGKSITIPSSPRAPGYTFGLHAMQMFMPVELDGKSIGTVYVRTNLRDLSDDLFQFALIAPIIFGVAGIAGLLLVRRLQRYIAEPIVALAQTSRRISREKNYALRATRSGDDELGLLADAFNEMLEGIRGRDEQIRKHLQEVQSSRDLLENRVQERTADLTKANEELQNEMVRRHEAEQKREQMQANLMEASRKAGMADVATGVLHNVGNVLNSINVSTQIVHDAMKTSRVAMLARATDLLHQHASDLPHFLTGDERGRQLPAFLGKLSETLQQEHAAMLGELESLGSNINHVREIVAMQQSLSRVAGVQADVTVGELIEDALKINHAGLSRHQVTIHHQYDSTQVICTDRHKVLQVLINLISNAKYAVNNAPGGRREMTLRTTLTGDDLLEIEVIDTGVGMDSAALGRIFNFGFTTKKDGHGFGLHSSALAAKELGGSLRAHSDGPGRGATFILALPLKQEVPAHA